MNKKLIAPILLLALTLVAPASARVKPAASDGSCTTNSSWGTFTSECGYTRHMRWPLWADLPLTSHSFCFMASGGGTVTVFAEPVSSSVQVPYDSTMRMYNITLPRISAPNELVWLGIESTRDCVSGQLQFRDLLVTWGTAQH